MPSTVVGPQVQTENTDDEVGVDLVSLDQSSALARSSFRSESPSSMALTIVVG